MLEIKRLFDNTPGPSPFMVCNSVQAAADWGLGPERSRPIIHGYDIEEFEASNDRQLWSVTVCSAGSVSRTYHGVPLLEAIRERVPCLWVGNKGDLPYFQTYKAYRDCLTHSLIYVHTGQRSPMPGARTEAMLSGCCIVTTGNNDAHRYIEHGVTGYLCETVQEFVETIKMLLADPEKAYKVGKAGREAARGYFTKERFVQDWLDLLADLKRGKTA